jgi:hypothetical protein
MKTRTHFARPLWDDAGREILERLAGVEDCEIAEATWLAAIKRWPREIIILRRGGAGRL